MRCNIKLYISKVVQRCCKLYTVLREHVTKLTTKDAPEKQELPTKWMLKAFDTFASTFQKLNKTPIEWDQVNQRLRYNGDYMELKVWYFDITVVVFLGMFCSTWGILGKQILSPDGKVPFYKLMVLGCIGLMEFAGLAFFATMIHFGEEYTKGYNQLMDLEKELHSIELRTLKSEPKANNMHNSGESMPNILGKLIIPVVHFFYHSPVSLTICSIFLNMDPFFFVVQYLEEICVMSHTIRALLHIVRVLLTLVTALEVCRLWPLLLLLLISHFIMINDCLTVVYRMTKKIYDATAKQGKMSRLQSQLSYELMSKYTHLQLTVVPCQFFLLNVIFILMSTGLLVCSICNVAAIKFLSIVPFFMYQFFLFVSIIVPCAAHITLPYGHKMNEKSKELISLWKTLDQSFGQEKRGYLLRKAKSIRSLRIYTGIKRLRLFWLMKKTKMRYYDIIVKNTVDLLLSIPDNVVLKISSKIGRTFGRFGNIRDN